MDLSFGDVMALVLATGLLLWVLVMSWAAHQQYFLGHDTWLFSHKTESEIAIQNRKIESIGENS